MSKTKTNRLKRNLLWSGAATVGVTWAITLYWTLVTHGYLATPWVV